MLSFDVFDSEIETFKVLVDRWFEECFTFQLDQTVCPYPEHKIWLTRWEVVQNWYNRLYGMEALKKRTIECVQRRLVYVKKVNDVQNLNTFNRRVYAECESLLKSLHGVEIL